MSQPTDPPPPPSIPDAIIPAGKARETLLAALANYTAASSRLIEVSDAMARALDEQAEVKQ
jgi:hypothetical protein